MESKEQLLTTKRINFSGGKMSVSELKKKSCWFYLSMAGVLCGILYCLLVVIGCFGITIFDSTYDAKTTDHPLTVRDYAIVFDCGSSGTRAKAFFFDKEITIQDNNLYEEITSIDVAQFSDKQIKVDTSIFKGTEISYLDTGLHTLDDPLDSVKQITGLLDVVLPDLEKLVKNSKYTNTPRINVLIYCTGGIRSLKNTARYEKFGFIRDELYKKYPNINHEIKLISGKDEGDYAFRASQFLMENLDRKSDDVFSSDIESLAVMEMGGSSLQLVLPVDTSTLSQKHKIIFGPSIKKQDQQNHLNKPDHFIQSWNGLGIDQIFTKYKKYVSPESNNYLPSEKEDPHFYLNWNDPCRNDFKKCHQILSEKADSILLNCYESGLLCSQDQKIALKQLKEIHFLIGNSVINHSIHIFGLSVFNYVAKDLRHFEEKYQSTRTNSNGLSEKLTIQKLRNLTTKFCQLNQSEITNMYPGNKFADLLCFQGTWFTVLFEKWGIEGIYPTGEIDGIEVSWSLGAVLDKFPM